MKQLDIYFRAFSEYTSLLSKDRDCAAFRKAISASSSAGDNLKVTRTFCHVDEEWVRAIEEGLVFIEKAIKEERQFIYTTGEVEPIEKVKHISKDSVQHLAKHSDMITREQTENEIIPDKLYSVERLNDYAVYENRFLYMLLSYLRDFVTVKYRKIIELTNKYDGVLQIEKNVVYGDRQVSYKIDVREERKNDVYLVSLNTAKDIVDRIELIQKTIVAFLATPLMESAGKSAMLKPPITKTNVLKMDNNFKGAVALYEYIIAYDKEGFIPEKRVTEISPFRSEISNELSEACALLSFLAYEHGLGIRPILELEYDKAEQKKKELEKEQRSKQISALKRKLKASSITPEEYILELEKQVKILRGESSQMEPLKMEINSLRESETALELQNKELREELKRANDELLEADKNRIEELDELRAELDDKLLVTAEKYRAEKESVESEYKDRIEELCSEISDIKEARKEELETLQETLKASEAARDEALREKEAIKEKNLISEAKMRAVLLENGCLTEEDLSDKESFEELEKQYEAFRKFYKSQWGKAKKKIRREILSIENLKALNKQDKDKE